MKLRQQPNSSYESNILLNNIVREISITAGMKFEIFKLYSYTFIVCARSKKNIIILTIFSNDNFCVEAALFLTDAI